MPSKQGFGNSRIPLTKKPQYGVDQKNPVQFSWAEAGKAIAGFAKSDTGKSLINYGGKMLIDKLFKKGDNKESGPRRGDWTGGI